MMTPEGEPKFGESSEIAQNEGGLDKEFMKTDRGIEYNDPYEKWEGFRLETDLSLREGELLNMALEEYRRVEGNTRELADLANKIRGAMRDKYREESPEA